MCRRGPLPKKASKKLGLTEGGRGYKEIHRYKGFIGVYPEKTTKCAAFCMQSFGPVDTGVPVTLFMLSTHC